MPVLSGREIFTRTVRVSLTQVPLKMLKMQWEVQYTIRENNFDYGYVQSSKVKVCIYHGRVEISSITRTYIYIYRPR